MSLETPVADDEVEFTKEYCARLRHFLQRLESGERLGDMGTAHIRQDITRYIRSLAPHVADREGAKLLGRALLALDQAVVVLNGIDTAAGVLRNEFYAYVETREGKERAAAVIAEATAKAEAVDATGL